MKKLLPVTLTLALFNPAAHAMLIQYDIAGVITSTTDTTGTFFGNGAGEDTGVGRSITASFLFDTSTWGSSYVIPFPAGDMHVLESNWMYSATWGLGADPSYNNVDGSFRIAGDQYSINQNANFYDSIIYRDGNPGNADTIGFVSQNIGIYPTKLPSGDGTFNYISVANELRFALSDETGSLLTGTDFGQLINWQPNTGMTGTGRIYVNTESWLDGDGDYRSGTLDKVLTYALADFVITKFSAREVHVPEPGTLTLFAAGLVGLAVKRRRVA